MSVNSNQQHLNKIRKNCVSTFFSFIADIVDIGDYIFTFKYLRKFFVQFEMASTGYPGIGGNSLMKKPEVENLVSDSL